MIFGETLLPKGLIDKCDRKRRKGVGIGERDACRFFCKNSLEIMVPEDILKTRTLEGRSENSGKSCGIAIFELYPHMVEVIGNVYIFKTLCYSKLLFIADTALLRWGGKEETFATLVEALGKFVQSFKIPVVPKSNGSQRGRGRGRGRGSRGRGGQGRSGAGMLDADEDTSSSSSSSSSS